MAMFGDRIQTQFSVFESRIWWAGLGSKIGCLAIVFIFCIKFFYCLFDTQMAKTENNFYMFLVGFNYGSKD